MGIKIVLARDFFLIILILLFWSIMFIVLKFASSIISIDVFNFLRFAVFIPALFFVGPPRLGWKTIFYIAMGLNILNFIFMGLALSSGLPASYASLISVPRVIFALFLAYFMLSQTIHLKQIVGVVLSCIAVLYLKYDMSLSVLNKGWLYLFISAFCWAVVTVTMKKKALSLTFNDTIWLGALSAPIMLGYLLLFTTDNYFHYSIKNLLILIGLVLFAAIFVTAFVNYFWFKLNAKYDAVILKPFLNLIPVLAFLEAYYLLDEDLSGKVLFVLMLLTCSLLLCQNFSFKHLQQCSHFLRIHVFKKSC